MSAMTHTRVAREAWFITGPGPDERLGSVVNRAAALYRTTEDQLLDGLVGDGESVITDVDGAGAAVVARIAHAIQVAPRLLWRHRLPDHPSLLAPLARVAHCPMCWREDREAGREPGLRRDWAGVLRTMCTHHGVPLRLPDPVAWRWTSASSVGGDCSIPSDGQACLAAIDHFGRTLEGALFFGQRWPPDWTLSPARARSALVVVSLNLGPDEDFAPLTRLVHAPQLPGLMRVPSHALAPTRGDPWAAFRAIADPAFRRAALWLVGWWTCPDWPESWRPGWCTRYIEAKLEGKSRYA